MSWMPILFFIFPKFILADGPIFWWNIAGCHSETCGHPVRLSLERVASELQRLAPRSGIIALAEYPRDFLPPEEIASIAGDRESRFLAYSSERPNQGVFLIFPREYELVEGPALPWWSEVSESLEFESRWRRNFPRDSSIWGRRFLMLRSAQREVVLMHFCQPWTSMMNEGGFVGRFRVAWHLLAGGNNPLQNQLNAFVRELEHHPLRPGVERVLVGDFNVPTHLIERLRLLRTRLARTLQKALPNLALTAYTFPTSESGWPSPRMQLDQAYSTHEAMTARVLDGRGSDHFPILVRPATCSDILEL